MCCNSEKIFAKLRGTLVNFPWKSLCWAEMARPVEDSVLTGIPAQSLAWAAGKRIALAQMLQQIPKI